MRAMITGGAGFVGSHLAERLLATGHEVTILDNLSTGVRENVPKEARFFCADIRSDLSPIFASARPELVYHLAAQVSVPDSLKDPIHDISVNIGGTAAVLDTAARFGAKKIIAVSSAAVYGKPLVLPLTEQHPTYPLSPYGLSKFTGSLYVQLLAQIRGMAFTVIRPANIYGPRQRTEGEGAVIPAFLTRFLSGRDPVIHGDGSQTRDFVHVSDVVTALVQASTRADGCTLNVSTGTAVSIRELWNITARLVGWHRPPVFGPEREGDVPHSVMDNRKAMEALDWAPTIGLEEGMAGTVAWNRVAMAAVSLE